MDHIKWPFGKADTQSKAYAATVSAGIKNSLTLLNIGTMTGDATLDLTVDSEQKVGDEVKVKVSADNNVGGRVLTPGTGMTGVAVTITQSKTWLLSYFYDGTSFVYQGGVAIN